MTKGKGRIEIEVWADWLSLERPTKMGTLSAISSRGAEIFSFEYERSWLDSEQRMILDPKLQLFEGEQYNSEEKPNFGVFLDSAPDRWGRTLQKRREAIQARNEGRPERRLSESDFLLGVHDTHRMGALRFKKNSSEDFLDNNSEYATPPLTSIRELEAAAKAVEDDRSLDDPATEKWVKMLVAPGGSLGGARPKASVLSPEGHLWIAKFPSKNDDVDTGLWEYLTHKLGVRCGITLPEARAEVFGGGQNTYLSKRFDRTSGDERIHFASAMTMLNKVDGARAEDGASYLEIVEFLIANGSRVNEDLEQLWRRIVFSMCVSNTDDHLRNHGFLLEDQGWALSPAFDINPNPDGEGLRLNVSESDNSQDLDLALSVAGYFRIEGERAKEIRDEIVSMVREWRNIAAELGIARREQERMKSAFRLAER